MGELKYHKAAAEKYMMTRDEAEGGVMPLPFLPPTLFIGQKFFLICSRVTSTTHLRIRLEPRNIFPLYAISPLKLWLLFSPKTTIWFSKIFFFLVSGDLQSTYIGTLSLILY